MQLQGISQAGIVPHWWHQDSEKLGCRLWKEGASWSCWRWYCQSVSQPCPAADDGAAESTKQLLSLPACEQSCPPFQLYKCYNWHERMFPSDLQNIKTEPVHGASRENHRTGAMILMSFCNLSSPSWSARSKLSRPYSKGTLRLEWYLLLLICLYVIITVSVSI